MDGTCRGERRLTSINVRGRTINVRPPGQPIPPLIYWKGTVVGLLEGGWELWAVGQKRGISNSLRRDYVPLRCTSGLFQGRVIGVCVGVV
jgi:hypothetical protein